MKNNMENGLLSDSEKEALLKLAKESLEYFLETGKYFEYNEEMLPEKFMMTGGAFVSIYKGEKLNGCIGRMNSDLAMYKLIQKMCISAATADHRFSNLKQGELSEVRIEISVLSKMKRITNPEDIQLGNHGIYIKKGNRTGTFLPQVAESTGWNLDEFLGHCSSDKAGLGWDGWREAELYVYTAEVFG